MILPKGHHYVDAALDEVLLFIRPDKLIPVSGGGQWEGQVDFDNVKTIAFTKTKASYEYYHDDGISTDVTLENHIRILTGEG